MNAALSKEGRAELLTRIDNLLYAAEVGGGSVLLLSALEELMRAELLADVGTWPAFRSSLLRDVAQGTWSSESLAALCRKADQDPELAQIPVATGGGDRAQRMWSDLTASELTVVRLVAHGMTNRAVARSLNKSVHTVNSHLRRAFVKLAVNSRVELARAYFERELRSR